MSLVTITNGTEQQSVDDGDLSGYEGWTVIAQGAPLGDASVIVNGAWDDLPELKARKHAAVKDLRSDKENGLAPTPMGTVQIDDRSKIKINGMSTMATLAKSAGAPFAVGFIMADNTIATLDADGAIAMGMAVGQYINDLYARSVELFAAIEAAATSDDLDAIDIETGWP